MRHTRREAPRPSILSAVGLILALLFVLAGCAANQVSIQTSGLREKNGRHSWRGDRDRGDGTLRIGEDGRARFETSAGRRAGLTLHETEGRRRLAVGYESVDWKGELSPEE
jgi:hypothetical protein